LGTGSSLAKHVMTMCLALTVLALVGCGGGSEYGGGSESGGQISVFAASSLTDAFDEIKESFEKQNPSTEVRLNFAGSSTLLTQLQQGAPADVFASADEEKMNTALGDGLVEDPQDFVTNELVVIVPEGNPAGIEQLEDLAKPGLRLVLAEASVPVARYSQEVLEKANAWYGPGFAQRVLSNIASREADVKAAANRVSVGDADATFVYRSDITSALEERVRVSEIPPDLNVVATYPIARTTSSSNPELAGEWVTFVSSEEGERILKEWGFEPAG
jgi:molybdate transport system substrate-binding protein